MTAREFTADELFAMLVAHPYGLAAMEWAFQHHRAQAFLYRKADNSLVLLRRCVEMLRLRGDVEDARSRARGRA